MGFNANPILQARLVWLYKVAGWWEYTENWDLFEIYFQKVSKISIFKQDLGINADNFWFKNANNLFFNIELAYVVELQ